MRVKLLVLALVVVSLHCIAAWSCRSAAKKVGFRMSTSETSTSNNAASSKPVRVYTPRGSTGITSTPSTTGGQPVRVYQPRSGTPIQTKVGSSGPSRSYNPTRNNDGPRDTRDKGDGTTVLLKYPQLLIRYRVPREKSDFRKQLDELQTTFKEQSDSARGNWNDDRNSKYGGGNSFYEAFEPPPISDGRKKGLKKNDDSLRRSGDGEREGKKSRRSVNNDEEFDEEELYEDEDSSSAYVVESDYYGDEGTNLNLADVPIDSLRSMELEGFSLEDIQMAVYGEFGIKTSIGAIKKRLNDAVNEKKSRKRTGKTRRDRQKAKQSKIMAAKDKGLVLPEGNTIQITELSSLMDVGGGEIVKYLMMNKGMMIAITQSIDIKLAREIVTTFGIKLASDNSGDDDSEDDDDDDEDDDALEEITVDGTMVERLSRPPVVTIMGHVDHGKTSLLDSIRKTQVAASEAGGITQAISAFKVKARDDEYVTFIDTPGHAAFSEMRKRGANVTDIVILVVAADDGIMEQTKECIAAAKAAHCPIIIAVNKIDKEGANPQQIMTDLMSYDLLVEEFGGEVQCALVSAKQGSGIGELLDKVLLQTEIMTLKAPVDCRAEGTVLEARIDKGLGVVVSALVQKGKLKIGDYVLAGPSWGRVRRLLNDQGVDVKEASPSTPVQIVGLTTVPGAGDLFSVTKNETDAREVAESRQRLARQASGSQASALIKAQATSFAAGSLENKEVMKVPIIIKGDVAGSVEALCSSINALMMEDSEAICKPDIVFSGVGPVTSSDVAIAAVSKGKVLAFNVQANYNAMEEARASNVEIGYYNVVYDLLDELEAKIKTTLAPPPPGTLVGRAEVKKVFKIGTVGKVAGCTVIEGMIKMESNVRIMRGKRNPVYSGKFTSVKVVKDAVQEVPEGSDCGLSFEDYQDFEEGDIIECFIGGDGENQS